MPCASAAFFDGVVKMARPMGLSLSDPAVKKRKATPLSELTADPTPLPLLHLLDSSSGYMAIAEVKVTPAAYQADMGIQYIKKPGPQGSQGSKDTATCCIPLLRFTAPRPGWEVLVASYHLLLHYRDEDLGALRPIFISSGFSDAAGCQG